MKIDRKRRNVTRKRHIVAIDSDTDASGEPFLPETLFSWLLKSMEKKLLVKLNSCGGSGTLPTDLTSDKIGMLFNLVRILSNEVDTLLFHS